MSHPIEERLRDAYQAKTAQLTEARLDQLTAAREQGMDVLANIEHTAELPVINPIARPGRRQHRWIAPALAAAAIAAVAIGVIVVANQPSSRPRPNPPASHVSRPPITFSTTIPTPSASQTQTVTEPPYLPAGQTGSRDQVPWPIVGSGWRLLMPVNPGVYGGTTLYLYDPAGGRYLISDRLPTASYLLAWSPDGDRALLRTGTSDVYRYRELDLHTGAVSKGFSVPMSRFISYTQPRGLAIMIALSEGLVRYSENGSVEHRYPTSVPGLGRYGGSVLYLPDGAEFVGSIMTGPAVLIGNDGELVRQFSVPAGNSSCYPVKWWSTGTFLEDCQREGDAPFDSLYLQPVAGGRPSLLTSDPSPLKMGHDDGWQLANGDVLLANASGCGSGGYDVLTSDGTVRPLRLPAGVTAPGSIVNVDGNLATFLEHGPDCGIPSSYRMIDYNMVTGRTSTLFHGEAMLISWPGDRS